MNKVSDTYKYEGHHLTRVVATDLILEVFSDVEKYVRREEITKTIVDIHLQRGGLQPNVKDINRTTIKSALSDLEKKGLALNRDKAVGYWIFCQNFTPHLPYSGMVLTPTLAKEIISELFAGKRVHRNEIIDSVTRIHSERGGEPTKHQTILGAIKKAGSTLKKEGLVEQSVIGKGIWQVYSDPISSDVSESEKEIYSKPEPIPKNLSDINRVIDDGKTIGDGDSYIYVYYYPMCRDFAEEHRQSVYPCKIGKTEDTPIERVRKQLNESTFQYPIIGLTIRTNDPETLEKAIQLKLELHGKNKKDTPGKEWFMTSPREIEQIYKSLMSL